VGIAPSAGPLYNYIDLSNNQVTLDPNTYNYTSVTETRQLLSSSPSTYDTYFLITGDINGDGRVDILDAISLSNSFLRSQGEPDFNPAADINGDGVANILDAIQLANNFNMRMAFLSDP
jgi:hypothetical protein